MTVVWLTPAQLEFHCIYACVRFALGLRYAWSIYRKLEMGYLPGFGDGLGVRRGGKVREDGEDVEINRVIVRNFWVG